MIVDTFLFNDEEDLLNKRFDLLGDIVDCFIVCQSKHTTTGKPKPIHFKRQVDGKVSLINRKHPWGNTWLNERDQRDMAIDYLYMLPYSTVVLHGDVDEIPDPDIVYKLAENLTEPVTLRMIGYEGSEKCIVDQSWPGTIMLTIAMLREIGSMDLARSMRYSFKPIHNAGRHYSWFGGADRVIEKLDNHTHQELNSDKIDKKAIEAAINEGRPFITPLKRDLESKIPKDIQTFTMLDELVELQRLATGNDVLELGTWKGASAIAMAVTAKSVTTIDTHLGDVHTGPADTHQEALNNIKRYGLEDKITVYKGDNFEVTDKYFPKDYLFDMAFIDATHTYEAVMTDLEIADTFVQPGGLICVHDYETDNPGFGLTKAVNEFISVGRLIKIRQVRSLIVCQKL